MSAVKIYHRTHKGCIYKCKSCAKWHLIYKNFQLNLSEIELNLFFSDIQNEIESIDINNQASPLYFDCPTQGGICIHLLKSEYLELEYLIGSSLILLNTERILQNV